MKRITLFFVLLLMGMHWSPNYVQAVEHQSGTLSHSKMIYVPEDKISASNPADEDMLAVFGSAKKTTVWKNADVFLNDCSSNYAFMQLESKEKSYERKRLYIEILNAFTEVYSETDEDIALMDFDSMRLYCMGTVPYASLGLTEAEAFDVFMRVLADHPLFYFAKEMIVQDGSRLYLIANEEFYQGTVRKNINLQLKSAITDLADDTKDIKSNYGIVKYVHDLIINEVAYAYEEGTNNPKDNAYVHSMAGYVSEAKEMVCDGYTETMAAMLNYLDVETICAYGWGVKQGEATSGDTAHAWNIVRLGNGKYYSVDATWNDAESGGAYAYFCLGQRFYESHSTISNGQEEQVFVYDLPQLSADDFSGEDSLLNKEDPDYAAEADIDSIGNYQGFSYEMDPNGAIRLMGYQGDESVVKVPSDIKGHRVVSITDCFNYDNVIKEIELPDTISYIGSVGYACSRLEKLTINAYNPENAVVSVFTYASGIFGDCQNLKTIVVNENDNLKTFWAEDNVLYFGESDSLSLVLYPAGKADRDYRFRYSMKLGSPFQGNKYIKNVIFEGKIQDTMQDEATVNPSTHVFYHCSNLESVMLQKGAPTVMADWFDGCVSLKSFVIPDTVTKIGSMMFNGCSSLKEIVIPSSVGYIESTAFQGCSALESCTVYNDNIAFEDIVIDGREQETIWNGCDKVVLYCNANSNTEKYARKFNIKTAPIGGKLRAGTVQITFDPNGGKVSPSNKKVTVGANFGSLPKSVKRNYVCTGWYTAKKGGSRITEATKVAFTGNTTLYAHWEKVTVKKTAITSVKKEKKHRLSVKWKKVSGAKGYRLTYGTDKKFKKGKKSVACSSKNLSKALNKLKKGKTYYIKVQAYKVDSAGNKIYGSCKKTVRIKMH